MVAAFAWDGAGVAAIILAVVTVATTVDRFWQKRSNRNNVHVSDKLDEIKAELMGHVTANRIQSDRFTRRANEALQYKMEEGHDVLLQMMSDLEQKVTKKGDNGRSVRAVKSSEKVG